MIQEKKSKINIENKELKEVVDTFQTIFSDLSNDAHLSSTLLEQNIQDSFSKIISETIKNPLRTSFDAYTALELTTRGLIEETISHYFNSNRKKIKEAYLLKSKANILHYSVILNPTKNNKRRVLRDFLSSYRDTVYSTKFPVIFQDIPNELEKEFAKEVATGNYAKII